MFVQCRQLQASLVHIEYTQKKSRTAINYCQVPSLSLNRIAVPFRGEMHHLPVSLVGGIELLVMSCLVFDLYAGGSMAVSQTGLYPRFPDWLSALDLRLRIPAAFWSRRWGSRRTRWWSLRGEQWKRSGRCLRTPRCQCSWTAPCLRPRGSRRDRPFLYLFCRSTPDTAGDG